MESLCLETVISRIVWPQQDISLFCADLGIGNDAAEEKERGHRIGERVMPAEPWKDSAKLVFQAEI